MNTFNIFIGICVVTLILSFWYMFDIYPVNNKQTKRIEWWITYWSHSEERYVKFKLFERKFKN